MPESQYLITQKVASTNLLQEQHMSMCCYQPDRKLPFKSCSDLAFLTANFELLDHDN